MISPDNTRTQNLEAVVSHMFEKHCYMNHGDAPPFLPTLKAVLFDGLEAACTYKDCPWKVTVR